MINSATVARLGALLATFVLGAVAACESTSSPVNDTFENDQSMSIDSFLDHEAQCGDLDFCPYVCVDFQTDPEHCGGCHQACKLGETCEAGECTCGNGPGCDDGICCEGTCGSIDRPECGCAGVHCESEETCCDDVCVDTENHAEHCGACGMRCPDGRVCRVGRCECPSGEPCPVSLPNASASCAASGECRIECDPGFVDCDFDLSDGCESLDMAPHCGRCFACGETAQACFDDECDPIDSIVGGEFHTCALRRSGAVVCWGQAFGSETDATDIPVALDLDVVTRVAAGGQTTCALVSTDGSPARVVCLGRRLGANGESSSPEPIAIPAGADVDPDGDVGVGLGFACAIAMDGRVWCWGDNVYGQLGTSGPTVAEPTAPVEEEKDESPLDGAVEIAVGASHACAIDASRSVWCWGKNDRGQLGTGDLMPSRARQVQREGAPFLATSLVGGDGFTCAVGAGDGQVYCWGGGTDGWLPVRSGDPCANDGAITCPAVIDACSNDASAVLAVAAGEGFACAACGDTVECWGVLDDDVAPFGCPAGTACPIDITDATPVIGAGDDHACARLADGDVVCWGLNAFFRLGRHSSPDYEPPDAVRGLP